jgi:hypothetical protein
MSTELELYATIKLQRFPTKRQASICLKRMQSISVDPDAYCVNFLNYDADGNPLTYYITSDDDFAAKIASDGARFRESDYVSYKD